MNRLPYFLNVCVLVNEDWTDGDADRIRKRRHLWQELIGVGFPPDTNIRDYVRNNWLSAINRHSTRSGSIHKPATTAATAAATATIPNSQKFHGDSHLQFLLETRTIWTQGHVRFNNLDCFCLASKL